MDDLALLHPLQHCFNQVRTKGGQLRDCCATKCCLGFESISSPYANNKGADQPAHSHSLISAFVVCSLDTCSVIVVIAMY